MRRVKLGQICEVVSGGTPKTNVEEYWNGEFNWITPAEINDNDYIISDTKRKITQLAIEKKKLPLLPKGTVLLSSRAPIGKVAITGKEMYCNQGFKNLICSDEICNEYLYWYLKSKKEYLNSLGRGATFKEISKKIVENIEIKLPEIERQRKIVDKLKKVDKIIQRKKNQSRLLDVVVQARFVEMFGDPVQNTKGWSIDTCKNLTSKIGSGATPKGGRESYCTEGIAFVRSMNVYNNRFEYGDLAFINDEQANKLSNVMVQHKDVLLNITGASVARCCIVPDELIPARVNQHVAIVRCKEKILPEFLCSMFTEDNYQKLLWRIATSGGATREAITKQHIENLVLIVPPMKLQEDYVRFSERVNKSKFVIHKFLYCTTHNTQSIIKPRPNTKESGKTRGGKPYADEF